VTESSSPLPEVVIYTDGACITNPGPGGYGAVLKFGSHARELLGGFRLTTNNRMELMAAVVALQALKKRCDVTIYSDSLYLVHAMREGRAHKWRKKGWKKGRKWVLNADLWEELLDLCGRHEVEFVWVRGHTGVAGNERADQLSMIAAGGTDLGVDEAYEAGETQIKPPSLF
jgi:ribonuclease HI